MSSEREADGEQAGARPSSPEEFLRGLAAEIATGEVRLPSFPDVATRVQRVLEDERATPLQVAKVVGADAALAARILRLANSSFLNPSGRPVSDLQQAVHRLGHQLVRCTAVSFALKEMELGGSEAELRPLLQELWRKGTLVASIAYVLARETRAANPDEALVTGLLHNVGQLYLAVRRHATRARFAAGDGWDSAVEHWHPRLGSEILARWRFAPAVVAAVAGQHAAQPADRAGALGDVLIVAISLVPCVFYRSLLDEAVTGVAPFARLKLDAAACQQLLTATARQIRALRDALAG
ncbi:MAG TPA: HDOD domain-containing protein [Steroidobacteraceae bacterium]|nr:HDOD domain-containing protein [Steroidobacteraceae bacterium]